MSIGIDEEQKKQQLYSGGKNGIDAPLGPRISINSALNTVD